MRTTITIDDEVTRELMQTKGKKSITAAIRMALQDHLAGLRKQKLMALLGQVQIEDTWQQLRQLGPTRTPFRHAGQGMLVNSTCME